MAFAETVNFDEYINDLEFRTALAVMKVRTRPCCGRYRLLNIAGSSWKAAQRARGLS